MAPRQASIPTVAIKRPSVDLKLKKKTNQAQQANTGRITRWLEQHGVPVNSTPQKKPKKSKNPEDSKTQSSKISITARFVIFFIVLHALKSISVMLQRWS